MKFDPDGLSQRILALPIKAGGLRRPRPPARRASSSTGAPPPPTPDADAALYRYDLEKRKEDTLLDKADGFALSADGKRALVRVKDAWHVVDVADKLDLAKFKLDVGRIQVRVDPRRRVGADLRRGLARSTATTSTTPGMHGADWPAMREKYAAFLPDLATRERPQPRHPVDAQRAGRRPLLPVAAATALSERETVPGGLLGADYEVANGRYRFKKVYGGLNWNPELRSPLTEPGVDVKAGEYLLAVEGRDLRPPRRTSTRASRTRPGRSSRSRSARRRTARARAP